jgi:hypothetical protein
MATYNGGLSVNASAVAELVGAGFTADVAAAVAVNPPGLPAAVQLSPGASFITDAAVATAALAGGEAVVPPYGLTSVAPFGAYLFDTMDAATAQAPGRLTLTCSLLWSGDASIGVPTVEMRAWEGADDTGPTSTTPWSPIVPDLSVRWTKELSSLATGVSNASLQAWAAVRLNYVRVPLGPLPSGALGVQLRVVVAREVSPPVTFMPLAIVHVVSRSSSTLATLRFSDRACEVAAATGAASAPSTITLWFRAGAPGTAGGTGAWARVPIISQASQTDMTAPLPGPSCSVGSESSLTFAVSAVASGCTFNTSQSALASGCNVDVAFVVTASAQVGGSTVVTGASVPFIWRYVTSPSLFAAPLANATKAPMDNMTGAFFSMGYPNFSAEIGPRFAGGSRNRNASLVTVCGSPGCVVDFPVAAYNPLLNSSLSTTGVLYYNPWASANDSFVAPARNTSLYQAEPVGGADTYPWRRTYGGVYGFTSLPSGRVLIIGHGENEGTDNHFQNTIQRRDVDWKLDETGIPIGWNAAKAGMCGNDSAVLPTPSNVWHYNGFVFGVITDSDGVTRRSIEFPVVWPDQGACSVCAKVVHAYQMLTLDADREHAVTRRYTHSRFVPSLQPTIATTRRRYCLRRWTQTSTFAKRTPSTRLWGCAIPRCCSRATGCMYGIWRRSSIAGP